MGGYSKKNANSISINFNGVTYRGFKGQSIAALLFSCGIRGLRNCKNGEERGVFCGMGVCYDCTVSINGINGKRACIEPAIDGLDVKSLNYKTPNNSTPPKISEHKLEAEKKYDIAIVGSGPAGLMTAITLIGKGLKVVIIDERASLGGQYFKQISTSRDFENKKFYDNQYKKGEELIEKLKNSEIEIRLNNTVVAAEKISPDAINISLLVGELVEIISVKRLVVCTGAYEIARPFPGWTSTSVITTGAAQSFLRSYRINAGNEIVIAGNGPLNFQLASELIDNGAKVNIGITAGVETDVVSPAFLDGMNRMDFNIVPSKFTAETFNRCSYDKMQDLPNGQKQKAGEIKNEKPIAVLFEGVDTDVYSPKQKHQLEKDVYDELNELIKEDFAYLHVGQWGKGGFGEDRKNIGVLIKSFLKAFANITNPPALVLKTNGANFSILDRHEIRKKIQQVKDMFIGVDLPNIYLIHGDFTIDEMSTLYNHPKIGAFITCTHGEGFGRPMLEASCCDLPVIASRWSGHLDFLTDSESMLIDGFIKEVPKSVLWENIIVEPSKWFDVNEADVVRKVRTFHKKRKLIQKKAARLGKRNRREFSLHAMRNEFNKIIDEVLKNIPQSVSLKLPKLKKSNTSQPQKLKLPKLKKVT